MSRGLLDTIGSLGLRSNLQQSASSID